MLEVKTIPIWQGTVRGFINGQAVQFVQNGHALTVAVGRRTVYSGTNEVSRAKLLNSVVRKALGLRETVRFSYPLFHEKWTGKLPCKA